MPTVYGSPRYRRIFSQIQTVLGIVNNSSGVWANTGAQYIRASENAVKLTPAMPKIDVPILTGTRSLPPQILARKAATWELNNVPLIPSGAAGTVWDLDTIFQNIFGAAPTISAGVSCTYGFVDTGFIPLTIFDFLHGASTLTQTLAWNCFVEECTITFNTNIFEASFKGFGGYRLDSSFFSSEDTTAKAGLTTYPAEPGSISYLGSPMNGFYGTAVLDGGNLETEIRTMQLKITTGFRQIGDVLSSAYGVQAVGGPRKIGLTVGFLDSDLAALTDLKQKAKGNSAINGVITIGQTAGSKVEFDVNQIQFSPEDYADETSDIVMANFPEAMAHPTAITLVDDLKIKLL